MPERSGAVTVVFLAVSYIPFASSSRGKDKMDRLVYLILEQAEKFATMGRVVICGDFNT